MGGLLLNWTLSSYPLGGMAVAILALGGFVMAVSQAWFWSDPARKLPWHRE